MYWISLLVPLLIVVASALLALARREPVALIEGSSEAFSSAKVARRRSSIRALLALLVVPSGGAVVAGAAIASFGQADAISGPLGRSTILLISPMIVIAATVLVLGYAPTFGETTKARVADLERRTFRSFATPRELAVGCVSAALLTLTTIALGVVDAPHQTSLFYFYGRGYAGGGGPFPGFGYGVPILISAAVLVAASAASLARIARAPRPTDPALRDADTAVRRLTSSTVIAIASFAVALTLAVVVLMVGYALWGVADPRVDRYGVAVPVDATANALAIAGHAAVGVGIGLIVACITFLVRAISAATKNPFRITPREEVAA
jgi:hypothetical protein